MKKKDSNSKAGAAVAEKITTADVATVDAAALVPTSPAALTKTNYGGLDDSDFGGADGIEQNDVTIPRLAIAQALSPQINSRDPLFIDGLRQLEMFNTVTSENYGEGPLRFTPLFFRKRGIEFVPRENGGGIVDPNVPVDVDPDTGLYKDARLNFGANGEKPKATLFHEWICVALDRGFELFALSMKTSALKAAKVLNTRVQMDRAGVLDTATGQLVKYPTFARVWTVQVVEQKNPKGTFGNYVLKPVALHDEALLGIMQSIYRTVKQQNVTVEMGTETGGDGNGEDAPF